MNLNRNRHTKREPKATDPMLAVIRFDDRAGKPIAVLVNFAAHPVMTDAKLLKYSADYPGFLKNKVEAELATKCVFMQGAAGDMSPNPVGGPWEPKSFGETRRRPRDRAGAVDQDRGPGASLDQGHGRHVPLQDAGRPQEPAGRGHVRAELLPRDHSRATPSSSAIP